MKIVIAPDSFKESLSALGVAEALAAGLRLALPNAELILAPVADGGEGTTEALVRATQGQLVTETVTDPLGHRLTTQWGILGNGKTAVIETAAAAGLHVVPVALRNPLLTTTYGMGQLIKAALDKGLRHFIIGLGGSATNDGGAGLLQALGLQLLDEQGHELARGGAALAQLQTINTQYFDSRIAQCQFEVACDVTNPLTGTTGASAIFGPQKGATAEQVQLLDQALAQWGAVIKHVTGKTVSTLAGAGAAGGLGAGLLGFCPATLKPGIDLILDAMQFDALVKDADLVITGEGRLDYQTAYGKTPLGVAQRAKRYGIPVIAVAGALSTDAIELNKLGIDAAFSITPRPMSLSEALPETAHNLTQAAYAMGSVWAAANRLGV
ncbi:glycerate kinase [Thiofilum flexile]|uniref:glycerate kinase family protein n=1 Tax=Thiofilum flexile TaxID=125627 RepID=UPI00035D7F50|nr:glycerate kinase [Thiofilum flexile]